MITTLKGFNLNTATFLNSDNEPFEKGAPVKIVSDNSVAKCRIDDEFCGICIGSDDFSACVALTGYVETKYSGTGMDYGYKSVKADGDGGIKAAENGQKVLVTYINGANHTVGFII